MIPVMMTLAVFNLKARRQRKFWRLLGYIPDPNYGSLSSAKDVTNKDTLHGYATRNFHRCLDVMLKGLRECQNGVDIRLNNVPMKLMRKWVTANIATPLLIFINDGKQGDILCGRFTNHRNGVMKHHRSCDQSFENLDNVNHICKRHKVSEMTILCTKGTSEERK